MKKPTMTWEAWEAELKRVAITFDFTEKGIAQTDWAAFNEYWQDGLTPEEAMLEDLSNA